MRHKQKNINQEGKERHQEGRQQQDQEGQQEARGVGGAVEVRGSGQTEADQGQEGGDGVDDEDRRQRLARTRGKIEVVACAIYIIAGVPNMDVGAFVALAVAEDAVFNIVECGEGNCLDDRGRQTGQQQQRKGDQQ